MTSRIPGPNEADEPLPAPLPRATDAEVMALVRRYQAGEVAALAALHERLRPAMLALLRRYRSAPLPSALTRQDLTQQSWVILGELATRWQPSGSFLAYFFRSFPRAMQRYVRQAGSRATSSVQMVSLPHDDLVGAVDRMTAEPAGEQALSWLEHLAGLPPGPRIALALRILEECDFETIGRALHVSRATAHRLYRRALATVAGTLTDA